MADKLDSGKVYVEEFRVKLFEDLVLLMAIRLTSFEVYDRSFSCSCKQITFWGNRLVLYGYPESFESMVELISIACNMFVNFISHELCN